MNDEAEYNHQDIDRLVLCLRAEEDVEKRQKFLDEILRANNDLRRIYS